MGGILVAAGFALASGTGAATPKCSLVRIDEWSVRSGSRHPIVEGSANGQPIGIMLDTGAVRSVILHSAALRLDLPRRKTRSYRMFGIGGETPVEVAQVESFSIGPTVRKGMHLIVAGTREFAPGVDVILDDDFFYNVDVEFDLAPGVVRLFQAKDCDGVSLAYWTTEAAGEVTIEAVSDAQPQIIAPVKVNGRQMRAVLDSGAASSIMMKGAAAAVGLTPDAPGDVPAGQGRGLSPKSVDAWVGPLDTFTIGNENIRDTANRLQRRVQGRDLYRGWELRFPPSRGNRGHAPGARLPALAPGADCPQPAQALFQLSRGAGVPAACRNAGGRSARSGTCRGAKGRRGVASRGSARNATRCLRLPCIPGVGWQGFQPQ